MYFRPARNTRRGTPTPSRVARFRRRLKDGAEAFAHATAGAADQEAVRRARIDDVIESTELRAFDDLPTAHDFSAEPRAVDLASAASLLAGLRAPGR